MTSAREAAAHPPFRLHAIMRQGTAASVPGVGSRHDSLDEARETGRQVQKDTRVLRVYIVSDQVPPRFVEWLEA